MHGMIHRGADRLARNADGHEAWDVVAAGARIGGDASIAVDVYGDPVAMCACYRSERAGREPLVNRVEVVLEYARSTEPCAAMQ